ncbi:hypothetical protein BT69DRAFT_1396044 [Atractiella rhizophila]|nr:hypothetical protein BT69DRAFT_1396044 [Atractiella rhizophila]
MESLSNKVDRMLDPTPDTVPHQTRQAAAQPDVSLQPSEGTGMKDHISDSHALATSNVHLMESEAKKEIDLKGGSPVHPGEGKVVEPSDAEEGTHNLGWQSLTQPGELPSFVDGWTNDEVWMLIRRFNMSTASIRKTEKPLDFDGKLDLNRADHVKFSPEKLRAVLERGYKRMSRVS